MVLDFWRWAHRTSTEEARGRSHSQEHAHTHALGTVQTLEEVFSSSFEPGPPPPRRGSSGRMLQRSPRVRPDVTPEGSYTATHSRLPFRVSVLRAGGLLHTLGGRRGAGPYGDALNYEAMLALDENNVRRGVRKAVLERLHVKPAGRGDCKHECHVCMEAFKRGHKVLQLPCEHRFCALCIQRWLADHITCPVCRWEFPEHQTALIKA